MVPLCGDARRWPILRAVALKVKSKLPLKVLAWVLKSAVYSGVMESSPSGKECWRVYLLGTLVSFLMLRYGFVACSESMHLRSDYDLNIYYLIGNAWMRGYLPYTWFVDLKGPLVFLFHGVGSLLTPGSFLGICLLHAPLVGLGLLFAYLTARLFLSSKSAGAVIGCYLIFLMYFAVHPAEQVWVMQHLTLYFLLRWARSENDAFSAVQLVLFGCFVAIALLLKFNLVAFWAPVCLLALWVGRWKALWYQALGFLGVMLPCLLYFYYNDALAAMWNEYVGTALAYGRVPWEQCALHTRHFLIFLGAVPYHLYKALPEPILAILGAVPCLLWLALWSKAFSSMRRSALLCLTVSFVLQTWAGYSGRFDFLHYSFVFYPYCFLSLLVIGCLLKSCSRLFCMVGVLTGLGVVVISLLLPWYVKYGRTYNGNAQMKETAKLLCQRVKSVPHADFLILDYTSSLHINRLMGRLPHIRHFVPPLVGGGDALHQEEQCDYIRKARPMYLLGSERKREQEEQLILRTGVRYRSITHRELGFPAYPPHAKQPELILYERIDD